MSNYFCRTCSSPLKSMVGGFGQFPRVSSDCKPFRRGGELAICDSCGLVQKPETPVWKDECTEIYKNYSLYFQSAAGTEQKFFDAKGVGRPRTEYTLSSLFSRFDLPKHGRMLDVGSGTGAVLKAFNQVMPGWEMDALEPNEANYPALEKIAGIRELIKAEISEVTNKYEVITFFHVLEHIPNIRDFLLKIRSCLTKDGVVIFQVPNYSKNSFDLTIADHCTHFDKQSAANTLALTGYEPVIIDDTVIPKELTVICRATDAAAALIDCNVQSVRQVEDAVIFLGEASTAITGLVPEKANPVGVFGSSIAAAFFASGFNERIDFFVDEDSSRIGGKFLDRPIVSPPDAPTGAVVFVCGPKTMTASIVARLDSARVRYRPLLG